MRARALLTTLGRGLLDFLAPRACVACTEPANLVGVFCSECEAKLTIAAPELLPDPTLTAIAPFAYGSPLSLAIRAFKYGGRADLAGPLAALSRLHLEGALDDCDALVPVPLHPRRLAERGYNQAALLARELGRACDLAVLPRALRRTRKAEQQVGKGREERLRNVAGVFAVAPACPLTGMRVALVDDVVTTGATASSCARALRTCGADVRKIVALARAADTAES